MRNSKQNILVIGSQGQLGSELVSALREKYGWKQVIGADMHPPTDTSGLYVRLDVLNKKKLAYLVKQRGIKQIYHLAAVLSAVGEKRPARAWEINMQGLLNVLDVAVAQNVKQVFWPSSIAVFDKIGEINPATVYGISKAAGEQWCRYYHEKHGLDVRSLRYPGLISHRTKPGGGTTDYAVEIFEQAVMAGRYKCFLKEDTKLPMMYMPDAVRAVMELMEAPKDSISVRTSYDLAAMSFSPKELADQIKGHLPDFEMLCQPDFRQAIADSWPMVISDYQARSDWGWREKYDIETITTEMLRHYVKTEQGKTGQSLADGRKEPDDRGALSVAGRAAATDFS